MLVDKGRYRLILYEGSVACEHHQIESSCYRVAVGETVDDGTGQVRASCWSDWPRSAGSHCQVCRVNKRAGSKDSG